MPWTLSRDFRTSRTSIDGRAGAGGSGFSESSRTGAADRIPGTGGEARTAQRAQMVVKIGAEPGSRCAEKAARQEERPARLEVTLGEDSGKAARRGGAVEDVEGPRAAAGVRGAGSAVVRTREAGGSAPLWALYGNRIRGAVPSTGGVVPGAQAGFRVLQASLFQAYFLMRLV